MCWMDNETVVKKALRNLCLSNGWSYGVFWRFDQRNPMLLTLEDAYYEEYARGVTDDMLLQVHILGEGSIGQAAVDGNHRWVFSDSSTGKCSVTGHFRNQEANSEFSCEFSSGIKTIVVIPLESCGVLQFGSVHKILETPGFMDRARQIFREMSVFDGIVPSGNATSSLINNVDQSGQFAPLLSSYNSLPNTHSQTFQFGNNNDSLCTDPISSANNPVPSSTYLDNQGSFSGFNPLTGGRVDSQCLDSLFGAPSSLPGFDELNLSEFPIAYNDDILQSLYSLPDQCATSTISAPTLNDDLLQALIADLPSSNDELLSSAFETHFGNVKREPTVEDILFAPMVDIRNKDSSTMVPKKGLFSELGLDQLLNNKAGSSSFVNSSIEGPISAHKKRRLETEMKSNLGLWAEKSFSTDAKSCVTDESAKATKKRARPGESTRPRPKDRQMIQDRIKELRDIIPNGAKCSIDSLLDRTIKHMVFMQSITKYVDKLKRAEEAKTQRNSSKNGDISSSAAWAVEVGGQNPIIVEDLGHSGQMLIEMACEEQGFFLEIADAIRSFGLTILKGDVESRNGKIWSHFIVEANRQVTRVEVLMSLLQLLKDTSTIGLKSISDGNRVLSNKGSAVLNDYHYQPMMSLPIGLADALR